MTKSRVFKGTLAFMLAFIVFSLVTFLAFFGTSFFLAKGKPVIQDIPQTSYVDYEKIDWEAYRKLEGYGLLLDREGNILKSFNRDRKGKLDLAEILDRTTYRSDDQEGESVFSYNSKGRTKLLIFFPKRHIDLTQTLKLNAGDKPLNFVFPGFTIFYILGVYFLIKKLAKFLREDQDRVYREELAEKDRIFKGLAHDMKTPLSAIIGYNQAIQEGLVQEDQLASYYEKIGKSAYLLKDRLDGLMNFTGLGDEEGKNIRKGDLLEAVRRYLGDNYSYYLENQVEIDLLFKDEDVFETNFDPQLFDRLLQNLLQNSIDHNQGPVKVEIRFENKTLFIKDSGPGIPRELWEKIFEPMVTGDASRSGEGNRGLGLANVKRICQIHRWEVSYDQRGFQIRF